MCELLEIARLKQGNISYYEIAKRLKVSDQLVRKWKDNKSQPNGINTLKLAEMAELTPGGALKLIIQKGSCSLSFLIMLATSSITAIATYINASILYIMLNQKLRGNCCQPPRQA